MSQIDSTMVGFQGRRWIVIALDLELVTLRASPY
jgi:hypothetical protein